MSEEVSGGVDLSSLGSFDFTPDWAKSDAKVSVGRFRPEEPRADSGGRDGGARGGKPFGDRRPFGEKRPFGDRKPFGDKKPFDRKPSGARGPGGAPVERQRPLDVDVKVLPETKALGTIIRKLQNDIHAYKFKDLAYFFLDNPQSVLLKITPRAGSDGAARPAFFQCKACGFASTREEDVVDHAVAAHLGDYFDAKEIETEPPKGNFSCVAKCGLSGVLLGPPNIHEFNSIVAEMVRTKFPQMSEEQYRLHIDMVRDPEVIEEWRRGAVRKTVYFAKGQSEVEGATQYTREQAEGEFRRTFLPSILTRPKHLMLTADVALKSPVKPLVWAVNDALAAERRSPYAMCFALRGAFHHRKLKFFRVNDARGPEFVTNVEYKEFDSAHAIPELAAAADFLAGHPCLDKSEFPPEPDFEKHLSWLVTTGHAIAFTNGVYSIVEKFPKYGPQWKKRAKKAVEPAAGPVAAAETTPVTEPAAEVAPAAEAEPAAEVKPAAEPAPETAEAPLKKEETNDETTAQLA